MLTNLNEAEQYIITAGKGGDKTKIQDIKLFLTNYKKQLDYSMNRFIDQFGSKLDVERNDKFHKYLKVQNEEYSKITRLERIMSAYNV